MTFSEFVDAAAADLASAGGRVMQRRESDPQAGSWWITFRRAAVLYRLRYDRSVATLFFEREQGSFVANSSSTWLALDHLEPADFSFEAALPPIREMVGRRWSQDVKGSPSRP